MNGDTISVDEVMSKIGYTASPDNEADLRRYIAEAIEVMVLPAGYDPFVGADPARVKASEADRVVQAVKVDTPAAFNAAAEAKKHPRS